MNFKKTKLASAVGTAALAMSLSAPANAVVLGGDNGWEVSYTGTINLFYNQMEFDIDENGTDPSVNSVSQDEDSAHLNEGLLPAFFTFKAKSPTVNGLTGTAQISFAPDSSSSKHTRNDKGGSAIDMREVFFNVDGSFGTISLGRTLGLWSRQAILKDMTLFGVGAFALPDQGGTTLGRIGYGYIYPEFRTRIAYTTPTVNGFQLSVGIFDPQEPINSGSNTYETNTPQFQGEVTYNTSFSGGGSAALWLGGIWQDMDSLVFATGDGITSEGLNVGGEIALSGFDLVGNYYTGSGLGTDFFAPFTGTGTVGLFGAGGVFCTTTCGAADNDGFYIQGTYTFNGKTKVGISYGQSNQDADTRTNFTFNEVEHNMWTVGIYHDVNSWLKLVAEYNDAEQQAHTPGGALVSGFSFTGFSVGGFIFW